MMHIWDRILLFVRDCDVDYRVSGWMGKINMTDESQFSCTNTNTRLHLTWSAVEEQQAVAVRTNYQLEKKINEFGLCQPTNTNKYKCI
jgi:hypothetical protein